MRENESQGLVKGALFLTLAGLISKILSAGYRIPLQNLTGDIGFYIYQQVYPLLGMGLILALYGLPSAVSKLTAEEKSNGKKLTMQKVYFPIFIIIFIMMSGLSAVLYFSAGSLADWMGDVNLTRAYQLAAVSFFIIPFVAVLRGIQQGNNQMRPTAYSQVVEQFVRVLLIIFAAVYISQTGGSLYQIGEVASIASLVGGVVAFLVLLRFSKREEIIHSGSETAIPWGYYIRTILFFGIVASFNHMVLLFMQLTDAFTLIPALMDYGMTRLDAMEAKGVLDRGQPLIQLGIVLGSSFALAMIPSLTKERKQKEPEMFYESIRSSMKLSIFLAVGATLGLIFIMKEANILLYQDSAGTTALRILVIAIFLSATSITVSTILQGLGFIKQTASLIMIAIVLKWLGNLLLVPLLGITGSAFATVGSLCIFFILLIMTLKRKLPKLELFIHINWSNLFLAAASMVSYIFIVAIFLPADLSRLGALFYVLWIGVTGAGLYFFILIRGHAFTKEEIKLLPFSKIGLRFHKERK